MKKAIAILLVLLVAGVAFGADAVVTTAGSSADSIQIKSAVDGILTHGFDSVVSASFGAVVTSGTLGGLTEKEVSFETDTVQALGYYSFATNTKLSFEIEVEAEPMKSLTTVDGINYYYVPYNLIFTDSADGAPTALSTDLDGVAHDLGPGTSVISNATLTLVADNYITGILWDSYSVDLDFNVGEYSENGQVTLPEGDYSANITVTVTTT